MKKNKNSDTQSNEAVKGVGAEGFHRRSLNLIKKYPIAIISILAFLIYFQTFFFGFVKLDDIPIIQGNFEYFSDFSNIPDAFTKDAFVRDKGSFYRPLQTVMFIIETNIGGGDPFIFHIVNVLLHLLTCIGIYLLFQKLKFSKDISFLSGVIYAVHPLFTHAVSWIPARNDLLITLLCLYSFIAFIKYVDESKLKYLILHLFLLILALFSKETAAVFPAICFLYIVLFKKEMVKSSKSITSIISWVIIVALWFIIRMQAVGLSWNEGDFGFTQLGANSLVVPELIAKLFVPFFIIVLSTFKIWTSASGLLIIIALAYLSLKSSSDRYKYIIFGTAWFMLLIIPGTMYSHFHSDFFYDYLDHRAYLPMIGILMLLSAISPVSWTRLVNRRVFLVFTLIVVFLSAYSIFQQRNYTDPIAFWTSAANANPKVAGFHLVLGELLLRSDRFEEAERQFLISMKYKPEVIDSYCYLGEIYDKQKKHAKAVNVLKMGIKVDSLNYFAYNTMAKNYFALNMYQQAVEAWEKAIRIEPDKTQILDYIVKSYSIMNQHHLAMPYIERISQMDRKDKDQFISEFYFQWAASSNVRDLNVISQYLDQAIKYDRSSKSYNRAGIVLMEKKFPAQAIIYWESALKIDPKDTLLLVNLVQYYAVIKEDHQKARYYADKLIEAGGTIPPALQRALGK
jgi:tetratricopeptide (TPR) repeat protein